MSATGTPTILKAIKLFALSLYDHAECGMIMSEHAIDCFCITSLLVPFQLLCSKLPESLEINGRRGHGEAN